MWERKDLKEKARKSLKKNYWTLVIGCFIIAICTGEFGLASASFEKNYESGNIIEDIHNEEKNMSIEFQIVKSEGIDKRVKSLAKRFENAINSGINSITKSQRYIYKTTDAIRLFLQNSPKEAIIIAISALIAFLFVMGVAEPLLVGEKRLFIKIKKHKNTKVGELITVFKKGQWFNIVKISFVKNIYTFLWYLTIIGGMIKTYEYQLIPYILAENPQIKRKEAFILSKQMMKGNKWKAFVLDLSFILWYIASFLTFGVLGILYVNPYTIATRTELYLFLKKEAVKNKYEYYEELVEKVSKKGNKKKLKEA